MTKEKKANSSPARFLESITSFGNSMLVPIDKIEFINIKYGNNCWYIRIKGNDFDLEEHFPDDNDDIELNKRFDEIKDIIGAK